MFYKLTYRKLIELSRIYLFLSFAGIVMVIFRSFLTGKLLYLFLIWNLFLAWVPLSISILIDYIYSVKRKNKSKTAVLLALGILWILFYPNAPYLITDFIHLSGKTFNISNEANISFIMWYDLIMISLFILTGFLLGFVSLYIMQKIIAFKFNKPLGWLFVTGTLFLSSFGIYLGRFIRWNSWDIISNPIGLYNSITQSFHKYALAFTITFGLFLSLIYLALYYLTRLNDYKL